MAGPCTNNNPPPPLVFLLLMNSLQGYIGQRSSWHTIEGFRCREAKGSTRGCRDCLGIRLSRRPAARTSSILTATKGKPDNCVSE
jgi:hypothetical protein